MNFGKIIKNTIKEEFYSEPVYYQRYLKVKRKSYNEKINTNFCNNKIPKEGSQFTCLSVILFDSVFRTGKTYYNQVFLEECKYFVKEKKISMFIMGDIEISSDSDRENSNEKKIWWRKCKKC